MSETLRDLVVSLSLQTDNFTRNIKSVNKQIQEAESKFRLAAAGIEGFEKTAVGLSAQLTMLERRLTLQKDAVNQYEKALTAANTKLRECYDRQNDYAQRLVDAKTAQQALKEQVAQAAQQYRALASTLGETDSATIDAKENLDRLKVEYRTSCDEVRKLAGQNAALKKSTQNAADAVSQANVNLNGARAAVKATEAEIAKCSQSLALAQTNWDAAGKAIEGSKSEIATFGKQISLAESRFKLAAVGIKDMSTSVDGLSAKLTMLREKLSLQQSTVSEYQTALRAAKEQLRAAEEAHDPEKIRQASDAVIDAETALNRAKTALAETREEIKQTNQSLEIAKSAWTAAGKSLDDFSKRYNKISKGTAAVGRTLTTVMTTPILALGTAAVKASVSYESAFASVRKTVDATQGEYSALSAEIKNMSTEIATSSDDIAEVAAIAGQLGIETEHLTEFARTMIDLGNSTDIVADEAATTLAKFANITGMDQNLFSNLGSTLVELGNNYATTESSIMMMAMRLASAGTQVGLSEAQILGFATALSSVGIEAEMGGSAFSKALIKMEVAAATGGEALDDFARVSGLTAEQFKALWEADPATAFQAFIVGLSRMDEEGLSAIATLEEIGISEIRLRDTLLRATNATELFAETQVMANAAWEENYALAEEAGKRYQTTASKLTNLKNKAVLFGQKLGDDLNPMLQNLIEGADDLLDKFMGLDEVQRLQIIKWAAIAAATGPALLGISKITKGISLVAGGIGKFSTSVAKAGGGWKGFMTVLLKSPAIWMALAAAVIAGAVVLEDYVSGAKKAREALEGMNETAEKWKNTAADTFYGSSEGLSFFGMSESNFQRSVKSAEEWLRGLLAVWTDGMPESDEIVSYWTDSFKEATEAARTELEAMKKEADAAGYTGVSEGIAADIKALDAIDAEVEALLKKRQNGLFTEADQIRLNELIDTREAIEIKYNLSPADTDGFSTIQKKLEAEVARAHARGQDGVDVSVYENAMVAAAEGFAAANAQIDAQYDKEYGLIMLMDDAAQRQLALDELNARYNAERRAAALEYANLMSGIIMPVWEQAEIQKTISDMDLLTLKMREYSAAAPEDRSAILEEMNTITSGMDESALTEYVALLMHIQSLMDSGMTEAEIQALYPDIDFSAALEQIAAIEAFVMNRKGELPGLASMFGEALPEEILTIATDLDMTGAQARWNEFASNPGAITTEAVISSYNDQQASLALQPQVNAFIAEYIEIPEGASTAQLTPTGLIAYVSTYAEVTSGADVSGLTPENVVGMVSAYNELASGCDISLLKPDEIVAYVSEYCEAEGIDISALSPDGITAFVMAYEEITGGARTNALEPKNVVAMVCKYLEAEGIDVSDLSPDQVEAVVSSFAEAIGCDKSQLLRDFTAYITAYDDTKAVKPTLTITAGISGYDLIAYRDFVEHNPVKVEGIVRLGEVYEDPASILEDPGVTYWQDGAKIPVTAVTEEMLTADRLAILAEDGTVHVLITPEITGSSEAIRENRAALEQAYTFNDNLFGKHAISDKNPFRLLTMDAFEMMKLQTMSLRGMIENDNTFGDLWGLLDGVQENAASYRLETDFDPKRIGEITTYVSELIKAILNGEQISDEDLEWFKTILDFVEVLELTGLGENIRAGIAEGMTEAGWDTDAETVATNLESAMNMALGIQSPSTRMKPVGSDSAAGIGAGMSEYDFSADASAVGTKVQGAVSEKLNRMSLRSVGINAMAGLRAGILAGQAGVISAMRSAARSAVNAAKTELDINSPSAVFEDEVGAMTMRGFGEGVLKESKEQANIIRNAARFLTEEAREGAIAYSTNDNRRTYNNSINSTIQVQQLVVRDEQDIHSLAVEIAALTRRQQRGRGLRMV